MTKNIVGIEYGLDFQTSFDKVEIMELRKALEELPFSTKEKPVALILLYDKKDIKKIKSRIYRFRNTLSCLFRAHYDEESGYLYVWKYKEDE